MYEIYNDDCFNIIPNIKEEVDLVCVDLPYGATSCHWDKKIDHERMWNELVKICKEDCIYVFFCTTKFGNELINSNPKWFRYDLVWEKSHKGGFLLAKKRPLRKHEMVYVFFKKRGCYNPQMTEGTPYETTRNNTPMNSLYDPKVVQKSSKNEGTRYPVSVLDFDNHHKSKKHRTEKPQNILNWIVKTYSNEGDLVLDFTMGSGSCGIAAVNNGRRFIGIEKDKEIFDIATKRFEEEIM